MKKCVLLVLALMMAFSIFSQTTVTFGTGATASYFYGPVYRSSASSSFDFSSYCFLLTADELYNAGVCNGAVISRVAWDKASTSTSTGNATFRIYMKNSSATTLTTGTAWQDVLAGATMVYENTAQTMPGAGWLVFPLGTNFSYTGGAIEVIVDWDCSMISGSPSTGSYTWNYTSGLAFNGTIGRAASTAITPTTTLNTGSYGGTMRPNIQVTYTGGVCGPANPASFTATAASSSQIDVAFTPNGNNDNVAIAWNQTGVFTAPVGPPPAVGQPFAGGTLLYYGLASPQNHTGLTPATTYFYKGFSFDGSTYSAGSAADATTLCVTIPMPWSEGFNAATIPACWSTVIVNDPGTDPAITFETAGTSPVCTPYEGTHMVKFNSYNCSSGASIRLISPVFSSLGSSSVAVDFKWYQDPGYATYLNEGVMIQWSTDGGNNWTDGNFYQRYDATAGWRDMTEVLPAGAANQPNVLVGFLFTSQFGNNCFMDLVDVYTMMTADLTGFVTELSSGNPLAGAVVDCGGYVSAPSAVDGSYTITGIPVGTYDITCTLSGYNDGVVTGYTIGAGTNNQDFALTAPTMDITPAIISVNVFEGGYTGSGIINVANNGNGPLDFFGGLTFLTEKATNLSFEEVAATGTATPDVESAPSATIMKGGIDNKAMWDVSFAFEGNEGAQPGIETDGQYIYTSTWSASFTTPYWFHVYDFNGNLVSEFDIAGATAIRDLAYDGTYFYGGAASNLIYVMDFTNQLLVGTIPTAAGVNVRHIAYDPLANGGAGGFWVGDFATLYQVDMAGNTLITVAAPGLSAMYGSAYDDVTPGGPYLWFNDPATTGQNPYMKQWDIATQTLTGVQHLATDLPGFNAGISGGLCSYYNPLSEQFLLIGTLQQTPQLIFGYILKDGWVDYTPKSGTLAAGTNTDLAVTFNSLNYPAGTTKTAEATFTSDPNVGTGTVQLVMNVVASTIPIGWCNLQWPPNANINAGQTTTAYARVWVDGITNSPGPGSGLNAWFGISTTDTDPSTWTTWIPATYNQDYGNDDEWMADLGAGLLPGTYYFASRFNVAGGPDSYGGYNAGGGGFWDGVNNVSGVLTINDAPALTWTGAVDNDWHNPGNWDIYAIPAAITDVTIPSGLTNYPTLSAAGVCNNLYMQSTSAGTATILDNSLLSMGGSASIERNYVAALPGSLTTLFARNNGNACNYFDVVASGGMNVTIEAFDVNTGNTGLVDVQIWYYPNDSYVNVYSSPAGWMQLGTTQTVTGAGMDNPTYVNPGATVTIPAGQTYAFFVSIAISGTSTGDIEYTNNDNTFSDGVLTINTGYGGGVLVPGSPSVNLARSWNGTVYYTSGGGTGWHLISSPITNALSGIYTGMYLQRFDEPSAMWYDIIPTTVSLQPMRGYGLWTGDLTVTYTGPFNTGLQNRPYTAVNPFGWNLLGNPYPSGIDWDMVTIPGSMNGAVYYLDVASGNYVSYNGGMGGGSQYVPPMQGFFVSATGPGTLTFDNSVRTHDGGGMYYKEGFSNMLVLSAEGNGYTDNAYIRFDGSATSGFDGQYDAYKLLGLEYNNQLPQVSTVSGSDLSINVLPFTEVIPVNFRSGVDGTFTIAISENHDLGYVVLEDLLNGQTQDLLTGVYTFEYSITDEPGRFLLHFEPLSVPELSAQSAMIYSYGSDVYVQVPEDTEGTIMVYDMLGQLVTSKAINSQLSKISLERSSYYVVKVLDGQEAVTRKVYID